MASDNFKQKRILTYANAIHEALDVALQMDPGVVCFGLGVDDPKGVFGTTLGLQQKYGQERVFDMPTAENGMTGAAIGMAIGGLRPVMTHQRLDFFLLAMDQLVNNAAKWSYMFGGQRSLPITIRLILGRGWGQGPTHSQNLQAWFAHIPGLKVVMPTSPADAKGLLLSSIFDPNPVLFLEHRWLHEQQGEVPENDFRIPLGNARRISEGSDLSIVSMSYMTLEAIHALEALKKAGVQADLIDLRSVSPVDWKSVFESVRKTGRLLVLDTANETGSFSAELIARVSSELFSSLKCAPRRIGLPDIPSPTSFALTKVYYPGADRIVEVAGEMLGRKVPTQDVLSQRKHPHDVPGDWFRGPF